MKYRKARIPDVPHMHKLINDYARQGQMLPRAFNSLYEGLREFVVAEGQDGAFLGTGALHIAWDDLAEIRSVAVVPGNEGRGIGRGLVGHVMQEAADLGLRRVFTLTYQTRFFERCGFAVIEKETLPQKVWKECVNCPKFPSCDEVAMLRLVEVEEQVDERIVRPA